MGKKLLVVVLGVLACAGAMAQSRGGWALGQWKGGAYWFPGVVQERSGDAWYAGKITGMSKDGTEIDVVYDDGDRERIATGGCLSR